MMPLALKHVLTVRSEKNAAELNEVDELHATHLSSVAKVSEL